MNQFHFERMDSGRLVVNAEHAALLRAHGLKTFESIWNHAGGTIAKNLLKERTTTRVELAGSDGTTHAFYLKRHTRPPWKEYVKPLLRLTWPVLGARPEWDAILRFHAAGIATMTPVALGESRGCSFLLTAAIEGCRKLSHLMEARLRIDGPHAGFAGSGGSMRTGAASRGAGSIEGHGSPAARQHPGSPRQHPGCERAGVRTILGSVAASARTMHAAGLHHQDFYLGHLMVPEGSTGPLYVIDLGRVRYCRRLSRRWIVKDLAQLNYSARGATRGERLRFVREYLGRRLTASDRPLLRQIERKTARIARHSKRHSL